MSVHRDADVPLPTLRQPEPDLPREAGRLDGVDDCGRVVADAVLLDGHGIENRLVAEQLRPELLEVGVVVRIVWVAVDVRDNADVQTPSLLCEGG